MRKPWMSEGDIVRSYRNSVDPREHPQVLADINGCDKETIRAILIARGCIVDGKTKRNGPEPHLDYAKIRDMYESGHNDTQIAREMNCSASTVASWRRKQDLPVNTGQKRAAKRSMDGGEIRALYEKGMDDWEIADELACSRSTVSRWRKNNNMPPVRDRRRTKNAQA